MIVQPGLAELRQGEAIAFSAHVRDAAGDPIDVPVVWDATGGRIDASGLYTADAEPGQYRVVAHTEDVADTAVVIVHPASGVLQVPVWTVQDDGRFVDAENGVLHLRFAYDARGADGWFSPYGGGQDGGIVELYYKPTSASRNLVFRNGAYGSLVDQLDLWEAEPASDGQYDHNTPDFASGVHGVLNGHRVWESAGRLFLEFEFQLEAWLIRRTYILYPWGDITVHARLTMTTPGEWNYLGHRFLLAVGRYRFMHRGTSYEWGGTYSDDAESFYAWSDGHGSGGGPSGDSYYRYEDVIRPGFRRNTAIHMFGRDDPYSGCMIDDRNGNDPDIVVMNGDSATRYSPFDRISRAVGGTNYVETALWSSDWAPDSLTHAGLTWFYMTHESFVYDRPMAWPASLGTWDESFHILLRSDLGPEDYIPIWQSRARDLGRQEPFDVVGARVELNETDRLYHLIAGPETERVEFSWRRASEATRAIDYRTAFVVEGMELASWVRVEGPDSLEAQAYHDRVSGSTLIVLAGRQSPEPETYRIMLGGSDEAEP